MNDNLPATNRSPTGYRDPIAAAHIAHGLCGPQEATSQGVKEWRVRIPDVEQPPMESIDYIPRVYQLWELSCLTPDWVLDRLNSIPDDEVWVI